MLPCAAGGDRLTVTVGERVVHVEELGLLRAAGQAEHAGERAAAGVESAACDIVVELAGDEDLARGLLHLVEQFLGALLLRDTVSPAAMHAALPAVLPAAMHAALPAVLPAGAGARRAFAAVVELAADAGLAE